MQYVDLIDVINTLFKGFSMIRSKCLLDFGSAVKTFPSTPFRLQNGPFSQQTPWHVIAGKSTGVIKRINKDCIVCGWLTVEAYWSTSGTEPWLTTFVLPMPFLPCQNVGHGKGQLGAFRLTVPATFFRNPEFQK